MSAIDFKGIWDILKQAGKGFGRHKIIKLSSSLAYFTIFSLGPMLLVIIYFSNIFWGRQAVEGAIYQQISDFVGEGPALQIQEILKNASVSGSNFAAVIGFVTLFIAATTMFTQMQSSLNYIWNLKVKPGRQWKRMIKTRLLAFSLVAGLGLLLILSLILNALLEGFMTKLKTFFPNIGFALIYVLNLLVTLFLVTLLFTIIFKVLPDAIIQWKDVIVGAVVTAALFMLGKFCITFYIQHSDMGSTYGSAGSLVILLLWIFYSSIILYFGAEITKAYAIKYGSEIKPKDYAVTIQVVQVESSEKSVQQNEKNEVNTEKEVKKASDEAKRKK